MATTTESGRQSARSGSGYLTFLWPPALALLALFGLPAPTGANPPPPPATSRGAPPAPAEAPVADWARPAAYCGQRFFEPLLDLAIAAPDAREPKLTLVGTEKAPDGETTRRYRADAAPYTREVWRSQLLAVKQQLAETSTAQVSVLIATVPDPDDAALPYQFDSVVEALRRGIGALDAAKQPDPTFSPEPPEPMALVGWLQSALRWIGILPRDTRTVAAQNLPEASRVPTPSGYFPGRRWLPWDDRVNLPGAEASSPKESSHACRATTPGILLFRDQPVGTASSRILALLLVGETPTSGAHPSALSNALDVAAALAPADEPIRIIGPTFSGGADALRVALEKWMRDWKPNPLLEDAPPPRVSIVSGSASGAQVPNLLRFTRKPPGTSVSFLRTTPPDQQVWCAYAKYLRDAGVPEVAERGRSPHLRGVVLLHEAGTVFGDSGVGKRADNGATEGKGDKGCAGPEIDASFPFHVASIRSAYGHTGAHAAPDITPGPLVRTSLDVSLEEQHHPTDLDSNISQLTPEAAEAALGRLLTHLSQEGVRHVAIRSTDISDAIFLAQKIREVTPDVRLAFLTADALLTHDQFAHDLFGSLVVSPYPFLGTNDFSFDEPRSHASEHRHQAFSNSMGEGVFNAVLAAYEAPSQHLLEYTFPVDGTELVLPTWLASIGRAGIAPIRVERRQADDSVYQLTEAGPPPPVNPQSKPQNDAGVGLHVSPEVVPPRIGHIAFALLGAIAILDHWQRRRGARRLSPIEFKDAVAAHDRDADLAIGRMKWRLCAAVRAGVLALCTLYMTLVHWAAIVMWPDTDAPALVVQSVLCILGTACAIFSSSSFGFAAADFHRDFGGFRSYCQSKERGQYGDVIRGAWHQMKFSLYGALTLGVVCGACLLAEFLEVLPSSAARVLFMLRLLPLHAGLSPATPILLALLAVYVWIWGVMARIEVAHATSRAAPPDHAFDLVATPICTIVHDSTSHGDAHAALEARLLRAIWRPFNAPVSGAVIAALAVVPLVSFVLKKPSSLERSWGTLALFVALGTVVVLLGITLIQFICYWLTLRNLTEHIAASPFAEGFDHLEPFARASMDRQVSRSADDFYQFVACAHRFETMAKEGNPFVPAEKLDPLLSQALMARARAESINAPAPPPEGLPAPASAPPPTRSLLATVVKYLLDVLRPPDAATARREADAEQGVITVIGEVLERARKTKRCLDESPTEEARARIAKVPHLRREQNRAQAHGLVASVIALLVGRYVSQFRCFAFSLTAQTLLLLLAVVSYAFEPQRLILTWIWVITFIIVGVGFWIFFSMDRDPLLSRIAGTPAGEITFSTTLVLRVVAWGALPLLSVAAAQYPHLANTLSGVLSPFAHALR